MASAKIDSSELEYLKFCRDKLRDIAAIINEENEEKKSPEDKLKEIKKIIKS